jgi:hypothetical protein
MCAVIPLWIAGALVDGSVRVARGIPELGAARVAPMSAIHALETLGSYPRRCATFTW